MAEQTIAHPTTETKLSPREQRGLDLFREKSAEIWHVGPHTYRMPSCSDEQTVYIVYTRPGQEFCPCPDFRERCQDQGLLCKHIRAALVFKKRSGECADCKVRLLHRDLYEVGEDHLTWYEDDKLCSGCASSAGIR